MNLQIPVLKIILFITMNFMSLLQLKLILHDKIYLSPVILSLYNATK